MADALWDFAKWKLARKTQDHSQATYCRKFTKEDGKIDFLTENAQDIYAKFQAFYLWPGIYTYWNGKLVKFTDIDYGLDQTLPAGKIVFEKWVLKIWTPQGVVIVKKLKPEWKKELTAQEFYNGFKNLLW
jgi:methionyl-tRNA formyltransferase